MTTPRARSAATSPSRSPVSSTVPLADPAGMAGNQVTSVMEVAAPGRPDLDPPLARAHRGVGHELEAEGVHVEVPGPVLVGHG